MNAKTIRSLRRQLGLTQQAFGSLLGLSFVSVNRWEAGKVAPTGLSLILLDLLKGAIDRHPAGRVLGTLRGAGGVPVDVVRTLAKLETKAP